MRDGSQGRPVRVPGVPLAGRSGARLKNELSKDERERTRTDAD
jgi:hypothetical protein